MTNFGWALVIIVVFSLYISFRIFKRLSKKNSFILLGLVSLLLVCINIAIYTISVNNIENNINILLGDKYEAIIVDCNVSERTTTGYNSRSPRKRYYYTPVVEFKDNNNSIKRKQVNYGLDKPPLIRKTIIISDQPHRNAVYDMSIAKSLVTLVLFLLLSVLLATSYFLTCYGFGAENTKNKKRTKWFLLIGIFAGLFLYAINFIIAINV